jgi:SAM-dependent methyltransferase
MRKALKPVEKVELLKLDLGCGKNKQVGFQGVDAIKFEGVDTILNLVEHDPNHPFSFKPWPWKDESVEVVYCSHFIEHLSAMERTHFFNELYRVLIKDGKATLVTPHWKSGRAYGDLTHQWPPVVEFFWYYLDKNWRAANAPHSGLDCDFACTWGYSLAHPWPLKNQEAQGFALNHYTEVAQDMICTAVKRGEVIKQ